MENTRVELFGAGEIRQLLPDITRRHVYEITNRADFPQPVAELVQGKVWQATEVRAWISRHRPQIR